MDFEGTGQWVRVERICFGVGYGFGGDWTVGAG